MQWSIFIDWARRVDMRYVQKGEQTVVLDVPFSRLQTTLFALTDSKMTLARDRLRTDHPCSYKQNRIFSLRLQNRSSCKIPEQQQIWSPLTFILTISELPLLLIDAEKRLQNCEGCWKVFARFPTGIVRRIRFVFPCGTCRHVLNLSTPVSRWALS